MAYSVSNLPDFKKLDENQLIYKVALRGKTIGLMTKQTGIKKDALINYLATSPALQSGASCGFDASGDATFTQRTISTGRIKVNMEFCPQTLVGKYTEYQVRLAANPNAEMMPFEDEIVESVTSEINKKMEKAVWQGDTSGSNADLNKFDGLLKLMGADSSVNTETITAATTYVNAIKQVYMAIPEEVLDRAAIFVSPDVFRGYIQGLVAANLYHYNQGNENLGEYLIPGTDTKVIKVDGLSGASKIVAADPKELFYGTDLENGAEEARIWFSDDSDVYRMKFLWNAGVQYAFGDRIVLATYTTLA